MDMSAMKGVMDVYFGGNMNAAPALAGQSVGLIETIKPIAQIIDETASEFNAICSSMSTQALL